MKKNIEKIVHHSEVSEKAIEGYLVKKIKEQGLVCLKYNNPFLAGFPDRLIILPCGGVVWVELKSKAAKPRKIQQERIAYLERCGHLVRVIDSKQGVDDLLNDINRLAL